MKEIFEIVCDTQDEADVAVAWCQRNQLKNITTRKGDGIHVVELEGVPPYEFRGRFSKIGPEIFIVAGER